MSETDDLPPIIAVDWDAVEADGGYEIDPDAALYEYDKDGETRYGVEWTQRIAIDDYVVRSLIFDERPDNEDVTTALTIEDHRLDRAFGGGR